MRVSKYLLPVLKETPAEATIVSHRLMLRAGMIRQLSAGLYTWLPLGKRVLDRIAGVVRTHMDAAGAQEILMPCIQPAELWRESGRYDAYGPEMLRIRDRHARDLLFGPTNEEVVTDLFRQTVRSHKHLPQLLYHIQWKFRDEIRPRFGVMRGREFLMKDLYSFDVDKAGATRSYHRMYRAYLDCFAALGLSAIPVRAETGPIGGDMSHEFHVVANTGESALYYDAAFDAIRCGERDAAPEEMRGLYAAADEMHDPLQCPVAPDQLREARGIEVGHIFYFGAKYSEAMGATVMTSEGGQVPVEMGSYGIGISRLAGAIIEAYHDEQGMVWPDAVAPFNVGLLNLKAEDTACTEACESLYAQLQHRGVEVLYDDRSERAGVKFATMDLIGLPWQIAIGPRGVKNGVVELKRRATGEREDVTMEAAIAKVIGSR